MAVLLECFQTLGFRCVYFHWNLSVVGAFRISKYWLMLASNSDIFVTQAG